jgi:hypothetical protein
MSFTKLQLESLEECFGNIPLLLDPCRICENKKGDFFVKDTCTSCSYFYGSNFKVRKRMVEE